MYLINSFCSLLVVVYRPTNGANVNCTNVENSFQEIHQNELKSINDNKLKLNCDVNMIKLEK